MDKEYYIVEGDSRVGPLSITQLAERGLDPATLVWTAGMPDWTRADQVAELAHILSQRTRIDEQESAFGGYARPEQQPYPQYGAYGNAPQHPAGLQGPRINWKTLAIVATVCGVFFSCIGGIVGAFAIIQASKAENAMRYGDTFTAQNAWSTCKTLCIVAFVLSGLGLIANIVYSKQLAALLSGMGSI